LPVIARFYAPDPGFSGTVFALTPDMWQLYVN
jgi:hypothetical protein